MHFQSLLPILAAVITSNNAAYIDYSQLGKNWPQAFPNSECGGDYQSPIDLKTDAPKISFEDDKYFKHYEDMDTTKINWLNEKFTTNIDLPKV